MKQIHPSPANLHCHMLRGNQPGNNLGQVMNYRAAEDKDIQHIRELLDSLGLPSADVDGRTQRFFVAESAEELAGVGGIETLGCIGLIRSIAVAPRHRGRGVAANLYRLLEKHARDSGIGTLYLLTETAQGYFRSHGFSVQERETIPIPMKETNQFSRLCSSSATVMRKVLSE